MKYNQPVGISNPDASYIDGDPSIARAGSIPPAASIEHDQREIVNAITDSGQTPSATDLRQLSKAIQGARSNYVVDSGSVNTLILTPVPAIAAYTAGLSYTVKVAVTNTGATTVNVSGVGSRALVHPDGTALVAGDLVANGIALIEYDGTQFQLIASSASVTPASLLHYGVDTGATNGLVASVTPGISSYVAGLTAIINVGHTNTGAVTVNLNGIGSRALKRGNGSALQANDITASCLAMISYDGTNFELINVQTAIAGGGGGGGDTIADPLRPYFIAVISASVTTPPASPATGDTYLVPVTATGGWSAVHNQVAQWNGSAWVYVDMPVETMVGVADIDDYWKRTGTGWRSIFASVAEALAGTSTVLAVTPAGLTQGRSIQGPLDPYWLTVLSAAIASPPGSPTRGDTYVVPAGASGAWSGHDTELAQYDGAAWVFRAYPSNGVVGNNANGDWLKFISSAWRSCYATPAEALAGTSTTLIINPADLAYVLAHLPGQGDELNSDLLFYGSF